MTEDRQPTCAERIEAQMQSREETVARLLAACEGKTVCSKCGVPIEQETIDDEGTVVWFDPEVGDEDDPQARVCREGGNVLTGDDGFHEPDEDYDEDSLSEFPLSVEKRYSIRYLMSTGGPGDWIDIDVDSDGDVTGVSYHFQDWFDHAEVPVRDASPLWTLAEQVAELEKDTEG